VRGTVSVAYGGGLGSDEDDAGGRGTGGCSTSGGAGAWALLALGVLLVRRRTN
jgi:uncharacterized protein (TIGR03382 family)